MMLHTSRIEISRSALKHNLKFIRDFVNEGTLFSSVVKGNAYGHGIEIYVPLAQECGVKYFAVFSADEAFRVKNSCITDCTILIMGMLDYSQLEWAVENDIEFFVFNLNRLENAISIAKKLNKKAKMHIELETGMNRTGFNQKELSKVLEIIRNNEEHVSFCGLCTHYAGAESISNYYRIQKQYRQFSRLTKTVLAKGFSPALLHTACSAATLRYPKTQMDLVRIGILQYGFFPNREILIDYLTKTKQQDIPLQRILSWKSRVMDLKQVKTGEFVGYGTSYIANFDMNIAIIPVGYSHGFSRSLSNQGRVLINGQRVSVIGMVNMNMITVDVSNLDHIDIGDEVVLIGEQGNQEISVSSFSEYSDLLNYELLTRLPSNLPRIVVE